MHNSEELMLYVHIPFCNSKCNYCDFLSAPYSDEIKELYVHKLIEEIEANKDKANGRLVTSIFFGGGTPSSIKGHYIVKIMEALRQAFEISKDAECTIECNPESVDLDKLRAYKGAGFNRISFGLQSTNATMLKRLGRIHTYEDFERAYAWAREAGFANINADLMLGLPGQKVEDAYEDVKKVCGIGLEHISAYSLIIEEGTRFYDLYEGANDVPIDMSLPSEDDERKIYHGCVDILEKHGYHQYEISNFSKKNFECVHNFGYWCRKSYLGFGIGAATLFVGERYSNVRDIKRYLSGESVDEKTREKLSPNDEISETLFLGLRTNAGVDLSLFYKGFGVDFDSIEQLKNHTDRMILEGLLERKNERLRLTKRGFDFANQVMSGYILD